MTSPLTRVESVLVPEILDRDSPTTFKFKAFYGWENMPPRDKIFSQSPGLIG